MEKIDPGYPNEMSREDLLEAIPLQIIRSQIAIARADSVLRDNETVMRQLRADLKASDERTNEAVAVLRQAGLLPR